MSTTAQLGMLTVGYTSLIRFLTGAVSGVSTGRRSVSSVAAEFRVRGPNAGTVGRPKDRSCRAGPDAS